MKNKRAITTFEFMMWFLRLIFLVAVLFSVVLMINSFVKTNVDVSGLQANVFAYRMMYSPTAISYFDSEIGRVYPGIIEMDKFRSQIDDKFLEDSANYGSKNREVGASFLLKDLGDGEKVEVFYNEDFFKEQKKFVDSGFTEGPGGARGYVKNYNVVILKNDVLSSGILRIEIVIPNS